MHQTFARAIHQRRGYLPSPRNDAPRGAIVVIAGNKSVGKHGRIPLSRMNSLMLLPRGVYDKLGFAVLLLVGWPGNFM